MEKVEQNLTQVSFTKAADKSSRSYNANVVQVSFGDDKVHAR